LRNKAATFTGFFQELLTLEQQRRNLNQVVVLTIQVCAPGVLGRWPAKNDDSILI
jgi:hypothetical protein